MSSGNPPGKRTLSNAPVVDVHSKGIPGSLAPQAYFLCCGGDEDWQKIEEALITEQRMRSYEAEIRFEKLRAQAELEDIERRERHDKIREDMMARQTRKDRKRNA